MAVIEKTTLAVTTEVLPSQIQLSPEEDMVELLSDLPEASQKLLLGYQDPLMAALQLKDHYWEPNPDYNPGKSDGQMPTRRSKDPETLIAQCMRFYELKGGQNPDNLLRTLRRLMPAS